MFRLPVEAYETADEEIAPVLGSLVERLVQEQSVADGLVEDAVEDVSEGFALGRFELASGGEGGIAEL